MPQRLYLSVVLLLLVTGSAKASTSAWVWANSPSALTYSPAVAYAYNPAGGAITITRSHTVAGAYNVRFYGLAPMVHAFGNVQLTLQGQSQAAAICRVGTWSSFGTQDMNINVRCTTPAGVPADAYYTLLFTFN